MKGNPLQASLIVGDDGRARHDALLESTKTILAARGEHGDMTMITNLTCKCYGARKIYETDADRGLDAALEYLAGAGIMTNAELCVIAREAGKTYESGAALDKHALPRSVAIWEGAEHAAWKAATQGWAKPGEAEVSLEITRWDAK